MSKNREEYRDPFEKMAQDLVKAGNELVKKTRNNGRPKCPDCGGRLWKKNNGNFSCPNTDCGRDVVTAEEIATKKIVNKFLGSL